MTALLIESFDHCTSAAEMVQNGFVSAGTPVFATGRYGRGQQIQLPTAAETLQFVLPSTATELYVGMSCKIAGTPSATTVELFALLNAAVVQVSVHVDTGGRLLINRGAATLLESSSAIEGILTPGISHYVELHTLVDNVGTWEVLVNGTIVLTGAGDTQEDATGDVDTLRLTGSTELAPSFDDLYVNDIAGAAPYNGYLNEHELMTLRPDGDGFQTDLTPVGAGTTNADRVDDTPGNDGDATYCEGNTVGALDSYTFENTPVTVDSILSVQLKSCTRAVVAGTIRQRVRSVATDELGGIHTLTTSYAYFRYQSLTDPNTAAAWTNAGLNAAEFGMEILS